MKTDARRTQFFVPVLSTHHNSSEHRQYTQYTYTPYTHILIFYDLSLNTLVILEKHEPNVGSSFFATHLFSNTALDELRRKRTRWVQSSTIDSVPGVQ